MEPITWFYIFLGLLIIELATINLVTIWFAIGALSAGCISYFGLSYDAQMSVFLIVSIALLIPFKPWAQKKFNKSRTKTNIDALAGKKAIVEETIDPINDLGKVRLNGMEWSAKTLQIDDIIPEGEVVEVIGVKGVKLIVKKAQ